MTANMETITPLMAQALLDGHNQHNRKLNERHARNLTQAMKDGRWVPDASTILIGSDGRLVDGQHRLQAIVDYGEPIQARVARGVSPEAFSVVDTGVKRGAHDTLHIAGSQNWKDVAAGIKVYVPWMLRSTNPSTQIPHLLSNAAILDIWNHAPDEWELAAQIGIGMRSKAHGFSHPRSAICAFAFAALHVADLEEVDEFLLGCARGAGLDEGSPILALRRFTDRHERAWTVNERVSMLAKAWNMHRTGGTSKLFRWRHGMGGSAADLAIHVDGHGEDGIWLPGRDA